MIVFVMTAEQILTCKCLNYPHHPSAVTGVSIFPPHPSYLLGVETETHWKVNDKDPRYVGQISRNKCNLWVNSSRRLMPIRNCRDFPKIVSILALRVTPIFIVVVFISEVIFIFEVVFIFEIVFSIYSMSRPKLLFTASKYNLKHLI